MQTKVANFDGRNGKVKNQFVITTKDGKYFQSYDSIIVFIPNGKGKTKLDRTYWDYSKTTGKYRNQFLHETKAETQSKIDSGIYELTNLN